MFRIDDRYYKIRGVYAKASKARKAGEETIIYRVSIPTIEEDTTFFEFWSLYDLDYFDKFDNGEVINFIDYIDSYDISLYINGEVIINTLENTKMTLTKIDESLFNLKVIINNMEDCLSRGNNEYSSFEMNITYDFIKKQIV